VIITVRIAVCLLLSCATGCSTYLAALPSASFERVSFDAKASAPLIDDAAWSTELAVSDPVLIDSSNVDARPGTGINEPVGAGKSLILQASDEADSETALADLTDSPASLLSINAVNAPLDALMFSLATEAGIDLNVTGELTQRVTLKLSQATLSHALDELAQQVSFAWHLDDQSLLIWQGDAYPFSYPIDYLNMHRTTQSSVGLATQVGTINASDSSGGSIANSSQTRIENTSEHRFWDSLQNDIQGLINNVSQQEQVAGSSTNLSSFSVNAEAGLINLYALPEVHRSVRRYLTLLQESAQRQVLIEATVVEVALSDSFEAGVDWQLLAAGFSGLSAVQSLTGAPLVNAATVDRIVAPAGLVSLVKSDSRGDISTTLSLLEQFGDVRILSRPRIIALNNQSSVLKVVDNRVYFTAKVERSRSEKADEIVTETEIHTVPVGLVMNVTPQISASGSVMLNVRPTLSRILGFVNDPNPELALANVRNGVPEIQVREMESMLNVQSGEVAIIGGLMQETSEQNDSGLPVLGRVPLLRHMFSQRARKHRQTELLIVLRPTVVTPQLKAARSS